MELIHSPIENILFLDIETVPSQAHYDELSDYEQELWEGKRGKYRDENTSAGDYYFQNAGIFAEFGKIICISMGYFATQDGERVFRVKSIAHDDEKTLLAEFIDVLNRFENYFSNQLIICGHNVKEFDIPYMCRRLIVHGFIQEFPQFFKKIQNAKPWEMGGMVLDTLDTWRFGDYKNYISLKLYTHVLGIPSPKDDIDGSEVGSVYYLEKDLNRIRIYCEKDVAAVANIVLKLKGMDSISEEEIVSI